MATRLLSSKYNIIVIIGILIGIIVIGAILLRLDINTLFNFSGHPRPRLKDAQSWSLEKNITPDDMESITNSQFDLVVLAPYKNDRLLLPAEIEYLKAQHDKLIIGYIPLSELDNNSSYIGGFYKHHESEFLEKGDDDNYKIRNDNHDWQNMLVFNNDSLTTRMINAGFDGVYLDAQHSNDDELFEFIKSFSQDAKRKERSFRIIVANMDFYSHEKLNTLINNIDAIGQEGIYLETEEEGVSQSTEVSSIIIEKLKRFQNKVPIFIYEYPLACKEHCYDRGDISRMRTVSSESETNNFILTFTTNRVGIKPYALPYVSNISMSTDTIPIFNWQFESPNQNAEQAAFRIFVSSTKEKLQEENPDIFDSGKIWSTIKQYGFIPEKEIPRGTYYWRLVVYEHHDDAHLVSNWSQEGQLDHFPIKRPDENKQISQTAWIPDWAFSNGFDSLKKNKAHFDRISPVWFDAQADGNLTYLSNVNDEDFINFTGKNDVLLIPTIALFDPEIMSSILENHLDEHVNAIMSAVEEGNYDGIDIDYEATYLKDKELFFEFLEKLSDRLHSSGKVLSVTVLSKWTDAKVYPSLSETREVQDWERIALLADEVRIMAYDYYFQSSYVPGPLSPMYWDEMILEYAATKIPKEKTVLALPLYAYSFRVDEKSTISIDVLTDGETYGSQRRIYAYTFNEIEEIGELDEVSYKMSYNKYASEKIYEYSDGTYTRVMYFNDYKSNRERLQLTKDYGIKGVSYWRLGGDDERNYDN